jgi:predicted dehydrogenase
MPNKPIRYAVVGTGGRCVTFIDPLVTKYQAFGELVALCDVNQGRLDWHNARLSGDLKYHAVPTYLAADFDKMIRETKPDVVIVTTVDAYHDVYVIRAMELGCDAVTE